MAVKSRQYDTEYVVELCCSFGIRSNHTYDQSVLAVKDVVHADIETG
jgi:hypothetical protein